jgi:hypothetical protein
MGPVGSRETCGKTGGVCQHHGCDLGSAVTEVPDVTGAPDATRAAAVTGAPDVTGAET